MESEQYAAPTGRRRLLVRAGSLLPPALVLCAAAGVAWQLRRYYDATWPGAGGTDGDTAAGMAPPSLRIGFLLSDPSVTGFGLTPQVALLALTGLSLLRLPSMPVADGVRRVGALVAGLAAAVGLGFTALVVGWVVTTRGDVTGTDPGGDTSYSMLQLDPWEILLGHGSAGLLSTVVGAGTALLLTTPPPAAPVAPLAPATDAAAVAPPAAPAGTTRPAAQPDPPDDRARVEVTGDGSSDERVVLASPPVVDPAAFRRPAASANGARSPGAASASTGTDGFRRPPAGTPGSG